MLGRSASSGRVPASCYPFPHIADVTKELWLTPRIVANQLMKAPSTGFCVANEAELLILAFTGTHAIHQAKYDEGSEDQCTR